MRKFLITLDLIYLIYEFLHLFNELIFLGLFIFPIISFFFLYIN